MKTPKRLEHTKERADAFLKDFEWTWTTAIIASLVITFVTLVLTVFLPSFWTYTAESDFGWSGPSDIEAFVEAIPKPLVDEVPLTLTDNPLTNPVETMKAINPAIGQQIRDGVAMGLTTVFLIMIFVVATIMQNWRRKLRGASDSRPSGGYR